MEDKTTTEAPVADGGSSIQGVPVNDQGQAVEPQPEAPEPAEAVAPATDNSQEAPQTEEPSKEDNSTSEWLKKKGVDPTSPEAIEKVAEMARNAEKAMHEKAQKASELEKTAKITDDQIPVDATQEQLDNVRVRNLELKLDIQEWKRSNPDKLEKEAEMVKVLQDPIKKSLVQEGYLTLDDVYSIAQAGNQEAAKSQGKREALENLAQKQQAAVPTGNAVNPSGGTTEQITAENVDRLVAQHDLNWFRQNQAAINKAMAGN